MIATPILEGKYHVQQFIELQDVFRYAWHLRRSRLGKRAKWQAYESLKRRIDRICGWSSRNPYVGDHDYDNAIRLLISTLGV